MLSSKEGTAGNVLDARLKQQVHVINARGQETCTGRANAAVVEGGLKYTFLFFLLHVALAELFPPGGQVALSRRWLGRGSGLSIAGSGGGQRAMGDGALRHRERGRRAW